MTDMTDEAVKALLDGATPGRRVQFHGSYCPEAVGTPFSDWDTSHDVSVIRPDGSRYRLAHYKHASDAYLSQMAPDLARALLDARAELAQARADAKAAVALVVEQAAEVCDNLAIGYAKHKGVPGALHDAARDIRALADLDGLAAVEALRVEARENAMQALASMGQAQEAYEAQLEAEAELARVRADAALAQARGMERAAEILAKEMQMIVAADRWKGRDLHSAPPEKWHKLRPETQQFWIDTATRILAALEATPEALAQTPTDPGDGWTWNERLGWIGPDGKPADPRRRG